MSSNYITQYLSRANSNLTSAQNNTYMDLWVEFDQKSFPLEAEFADPGPVEGINFGGALKFKRWTLRDTFVI